MGALGLAPSWPRWRRGYNPPRSLYLQRSRWGDRWDLHPFRRGSRPRSSTASDSTTISPPWRTCTSIARLSAKCSALELRAETPVWVTGIAPAASSSRTTRSAPELHPDDVVYVVGVAPTFPRSRTECLRYWATRRKDAPCLKAGDASSGCHTTRRPGSRSGQGTPPVNRTLLPGLGNQGRPRRRRKKHHREDSNLNHRPTQDRVPPWNGGISRRIYSSHREDSNLSQRDS